MEQDNSETIRLLIVEALAEEAEAILNVFRDAGFSTRAQHITSLVHLDEALSGHQKWDLLLLSGQDMPEQLTVESILEKLEQQGRDIPAILMSDEIDDEESLNYLRQGIRCVIPQHSDDMLLLTVRKELSDLNTRRHHRRMSVALHESEKQRRNLLDDQVDAVVYISEGVIRYTNTAFNKLLGVDEEPEALLGKAFNSLVAPDEQAEVGEFLITIEDSGQAVAAIQCQLVADSHKLPVRIIASPTSYENHFTLSLQVRTEQEGPQTQALTNEASDAPKKSGRLCPKKQFLDHLDTAIQRVVVGKEHYALVCVSVDSLKSVHADNGKEASLQLFREVAKRLGLSLIEHQVCSWGGGQFMTLLKANDQAAVERIATQALEEVTALPVAYEKEELPVQLSLGAILLSDENSDANTLLVRARHACAEARRLGGGQLNFFQKRKVSVVSSVEKHLAGMVSQAMQHDQMKLFYQPVISLKGSDFGHYEVMLRMVDARGRQHEASTFRSKLDKNSLWGKVDRWQLIQASKDLIKHKATSQKTRLMIHLGGNVITDESFLPWMGVALKAAGIKPQTVIVELSEQNVVRFSEQVPGFLKSLKAMGCSTQVSEFGCSLNPVETIAPLAVDFVKVDASFTKDLTSESKGEELSNMVQALADSGRQIIVPHVQSAQEMAPLWHSGVDFIQGDFLQEPTDSMNYNFEE